MSYLDSLFNDLTHLQSQLQQAANSLWHIRLALTRAYRRGFSDKDFLPRRLSKRRGEIQEQFDILRLKLNQLISREFQSSLIGFDSIEDVETARRIRTKIRYLQNAFAADLPIVGQTLSRLDKALPQVMT
jgi:septal ring factor EnvC (AmiA/AmiB activator)